MNKWDEMREAYREAEVQIRAADAVAVDMAAMLRGRLRAFRGTLAEEVLAALKRELRDFNANTKRWSR